VVIYADDRFPMDGMNEKGLVGHTRFYTGGGARGPPCRASPPGRCWKPPLAELSARQQRHRGRGPQGHRRRAPGTEKAADRLRLGHRHIKVEDATGDSAIIEITQGKVNVATAASTPC
jgi:choloylglycine hydrolase